MPAQPTSTSPGAAQRRAPRRSSEAQNGPHAHSAPIWADLGEAKTADCLECRQKNGFHPDGVKAINHPMTLQRATCVRGPAEAVISTVVVVPT